MHVADYNRDGRANEFYLQTESEPGGKSAGVIIGITKLRPRLHAFGTASNPDKPLRLQKREWDALRRASGPIEVMDWPCEDHGDDTETTLRLRWTQDGVEGTRRAIHLLPEEKSPDKRGAAVIASAVAQQRARGLWP